MRTLLAGLEVFRRNPMAIVPISIEGLAVALALVFGVLPARAASAAGGAVFPLDIYFDVKQALASASSWVVFVVVVAISVCVRTGVLVLTLWLADPPSSKPITALRDAAALVGTTALMFIPVAVLFFAGTAMRYAPFIVVAAPIGFAIALRGVRRALRLNVGAGPPPSQSTPEAAPYLAYVYVVAISGAAISYMGDRSTFLAAVMVIAVGPLHALYLLGWRENARAEVYPGGGVLALTATVVVGAILATGTFYDRVVRTPSPVARTQKSGSIALLGGADSSTATGALSELDVRSLGYREDRALLLSYTSSARYVAADTRQDLGRAARFVADQARQIEDLEAVVGHSQAALVVDRILARGTELPGVVSLAPPPPRPPHLAVPPGDASGPGLPGGELSRGLSWLLQALGLPGFDIDAPSAPVRLDEVVAEDAKVPRLAVWALGDALWLDTDWRRPGELNIVALTDHVGVTKNGRALDAAQDFLAGRPIVPDTGSWRAILVPIVRYAFEPWRPENR